MISIYITPETIKNNLKKSVAFLWLYRLFSGHDRYRKNNIGYVDLLIKKGEVLLSMMVVSANFFSYVTSYYSGSIVRYIRRYIYQWLHYTKDFKYRFWLLSLRFLPCDRLKMWTWYTKLLIINNVLALHGQKLKLAPVLRSCVRPGEIRQPIFIKKLDASSCPDD